jgi:hypothetical protein
MSGEEMRGEMREKNSQQAKPKTKPTGKAMKKQRHSDIM